MTKVTSMKNLVLITTTCLRDKSILCVENDVPWDKVRYFTAHWRHQLALCNCNYSCSFFSSILATNRRILENFIDAVIVRKLPIFTCLTTGFNAFNDKLYLAKLISNVVNSDLFCLISIYSMMLEDFRRDDHKITFSDLGWSYDARRFYSVDLI